MASLEISVTQALAELKMLRKRIANGLLGAKFTVLRTKKSMVDAEKFSTAATGAYQSYTDLLARFNALKAAIVLSNAVTRVTIGGKSYTVAEAVERKRSIEHQKELLKVMQAQFAEVQRQHKAHVEQEQLRVDRMLTAELSKDSKTNVDVIKSLTETILAENKADILDPLKLEERISVLHREIEEFETTVDWILSESNGRTMIKL